MTEAEDRTRRVINSLFPLFPEPKEKRHLGEPGTPLYIAEESLKDINEDFERRVEVEKAFTAEKIRNTIFETIKNLEDQLPERVIIFIGLPHITTSQFDDNEVLGSFSKTLELVVREQRFEIGFGGRSKFKDVENLINNSGKPKILSDKEWFKFAPMILEAINNHLRSLKQK